MPNEELRLLTRRDVIRGSALLLGGACACQTLAGAGATCCDTPDLEPGCLSFGERSVTVDLARAGPLSVTHGAGRIVSKERSLDILVVRAGKNRYCAVAGKCSHAGRPLNYVRARGLIQCSNFGHATFALDGKHIRGPEVRRPIQSFPVKLVRGRLEIALAPGPAPGKS